MPIATVDEIPQQCPSSNIHCNVFWHVLTRRVDISGESIFGIVLVTFWHWKKDDLLPNCGWDDKTLPLGWKCLQRSLRREITSFTESYWQGLAAQKKNIFDVGKARSCLWQPNCRVNQVSFDLLSNPTQSWGNYLGCSHIAMNTFAGFRI